MEEKKEEKKLAHFKLKDVSEKVHAVDIEGDKFDVAHLIAQAYCCDDEVREVINLAMRLVHEFAMEIVDERRKAQMGEQEE